MEVKILSKCDADLAQHLGNNSLLLLEGLDLSTDSHLSDIKSELTTENTSLSSSLSVERKHEFTEELAVLDDEFDSRVICMKKFIEANTHSSDQTIAKNAEKALDKMATYDLAFYKLGYEKELARAFSLIDEYEKPDMKPVIESLVGVAQPLAEMKTAATNLNALYVKNQDVLALKQEIVPSTLQKKVVIDIFNNKLLPYLMVMANVKPDVYGETYTKITQYIETINTKVRSQRNRPVAEEEVSSEVE
ncbi:DUF6261 family protein [Marinifilum fragile]|uniref:DUF6261 family protein n=1 Tax=Marinifilum fragile TaxID=570161 RepID=UPI002AA682B4|nr:DUF6261 family protein [Marinifilum fragile]